MKKERAASGKAARSGKALLGGNTPDSKHPAPKNQFTKRCAARTDGPRLAVQSWHHIACVLARKPQDDTALSAAMRRALEERGRA